MNRILNEIQTKIYEAIKEYLPDILPEMLEENGKVYYMNGENGTEYDWFINEHISTFMVFYNDEENLGAAKATVYADGELYIYLYGNCGKDLVKEVNSCLDVSADELLQLAVCLKENADNKEIWDADIESIDSDAVPDQETVDEFSDNKKSYEAIIRLKAMMNQACLVSRRITSEGCLVGYMLREEPDNEDDSGWWFSAGDEDEEYINNAENFELCAVRSIVDIDPAIMRYIDSPVGSGFIRITDEDFEEDNE